MLKDFVEIAPETKANLKYHRQMQNVTNQIIYRNSKYVNIEGQVYRTADFDAVVDGSIKLLWQTNTQLLAQTNDRPVKYQAINALDVDEYDDLSQQPFYQFKFRSIKQGGDQMITEKVVGTTFAFQEHGYHPGSDFAGELTKTNGRQALIGQAILLPQPDNQYDPHAVAVVAKLKTGASFALGYLAKGSQLYQQIKAPTLAKLTIVNFSDDGLNDSYTVAVDLGA